ncbi:amidohydrolase [soil metagenome]
MDNEELKQRAIEAIDREVGRLAEVGWDIFRHPELGFKERRTAGVVAREFGRLGLGFHEELALTGVKATVQGRGGPGPNIAIIGELDSVLVAAHPDADPHPGAAPCCGHNAQITTMLGVATGLVSSGVLDELAGSVTFFAVPAEEYVELEERLGLREQGKTEFLGGKSELVRLGAFDDVDMAMMVHAGAFEDGTICSLNDSCNGFVGKQARFIGKAAHAGGAPHDGINALYAANLALEAINAQRETYQDGDSVRIHPILTRGGDLVNVIPNDVRLETMIRGKTLDAIVDADRKVDRALKAGALAMGAQVEITSLPGYLPLRNDAGLSAVFKENLLRHFPESAWEDAGHGSWSTDLGDLSAIMPVIEPNMAGFAGTVHGSDWRIIDDELAYIWPAKLMSSAVIDLLANGASRATQIVDDYDAGMTLDEYVAFMRRASRAETFSGFAG